MTMTDDMMKTLRNPTPLYAVAGTADLAAEKLREVPVLLEKLRVQAPEQFEKLRGTDPKVVQERVTTQAKGAQSRLNETFAGLDLNLDLKKLGESVQDLALQSVGRAAEYAVKARETYDDLAVRGKGAVAGWRGEAADEVVEIAAVVEPKPAPKAQKAAPKAADPAKKAPAARKAAPKKTDK
ncbi:hypothetical protein [Streptomyces sp. CA-111067]|uniref:hypothetical protein n=1 Tax=Streptomyces sp. CA-111067 TaxID=3240046 RepID=UPI003D96C666